MFDLITNWQCMANHFKYKQKMDMKGHKCELPGCNKDIPSWRHRNATTCCKEHGKELKRLREAANNTYRAEFIYDNIMMEANVIHAAYMHNVKKLLFLGSSCIYPKMAPQPIKEEYLNTGYLEPTNQPYAIAKIAGIEMCESYRTQYGSNFISAMPTNLYGTNDNYHPENSHVLPALIRRIILAKKNNDPSVVIWGTGTPRREFMHVDDLADACYFLLQNYDEAGHVNIGWGSDVSIKQVAETIASEVGYKGTLEFDTTKPDGTPRKLLDTTKINKLGWKPSIKLEDGIRRTIEEMRDKF